MLPNSQETYVPAVLFGLLIGLAIGLLVAWVYFLTWRARYTTTIRQDAVRSEEHTSELQSRPHLVCRLLLEKKKSRATPIPSAPRPRSGSLLPFSPSCPPP